MIEKRLMFLFSLPEKDPTSWTQIIIVVKEVKWAALPQRPQALWELQFVWTMSSPRLLPSRAAVFRTMFVLAYIVSVFFLDHYVSSLLLSSGDVPVGMIYHTSPSCTELDVSIQICSVPLHHGHLIHLFISWSLIWSSCWVFTWNAHRNCHLQCMYWFVSCHFLTDCKVKIL